MELITCNDCGCDLDESELGDFFYYHCSYCGKRQCIDCWDGVVEIYVRPIRDSICATDINYSLRAILSGKSSVNWYCSEKCARGED